MSRRAVIVAALLLALAPSASAHPGAPRWSLSVVMHRLNGATIQIGGWHGRVKRASTLCSGEGAPIKWGGVSHWRHFVCTWTTFRAGALVDRDVTFRVHTLSGARYVITNAHWGAS